ncbi:MAG TPA: retropepsin-like aspartic protease [Terracidiphilus sp.]
MRLFVFFFAAIFPGALIAQNDCPANVKAIPLHTLDRHQMVVSVFINHAGPYEFLLDTGTQMTVVDRALAADLHLSSTGKATVAGVSVQGAASFARVESLELGDHAVLNQGVVVYDMKNVRGAGFALRGLLGEDFLSRYDVLIDKNHAVLCIDDTGAMLESLKGDNSSRSAGERSSASPAAAGPGRR